VADGGAVNAPLVRLLENALAGAKAGSFKGGAVLVCDGNREFHHFANVGAFVNFLPLIAGASILLMDLQMTMRAQQQAHAHQLLRAVPEQFKPRGGLDG
jgi:hypothetical protein